METKEKRTGRQRPARKERPHRRSQSAEVVYTQPETFNRRRFVLRLLTVLAVVVALLIGIAIFFSVNRDKSTVAKVGGNDRYSAWTIWEASGIQDGDNLLTLNKSRAASKIKEELPYVDTVRIGIKLPDTVHIEVKELDVVYSIASNDGNWWLISYEGRVVDRTTEAQAGEYTKILGVKLASPIIGEMAVASEAVPVSTEDGTEKPVTVLGKERLNAAIQIMTQLEASGVIGMMASINVAELSNIELWYGQRYQVMLGDTSSLEKKIVSMKQVIDNRGEYQTGILDVSFTRSDEVWYTELP